MSEPSAPSPYRQIWRYLLVGGLAVAIDGGVYFLLTASGQMSAAAAKRVSFAAGAIWGFFANKYFTFGQRDLSLKEPVLFALVYAGGWFLNSVIHDVTLRFTGMKPLAFLTATGVSTCTNFAGQKWLVFRARRQSPVKQ